MERKVKPGNSLDIHSPGPMLYPRVKRIEVVVIIEQHFSNMKLLFLKIQQRYSPAITITENIHGKLLFKQHTVFLTRGVDICDAVIHGTLPWRSYYII